MTDGKVTIAIDIQDKDSRRTVKGLEDSFEGIGGTAKRAGRNIRDMFVSLGLVKMATAAFNVLRSSIDGAISRVDTMNQFPKMMQAIGFSAEDSNKSINRLSDGIQGLPTTLPSVVATTQQLAIMTGDLDMATELTLALNNAFLTSGASAEDASRGLTQYTQMLATGKVDVMSFRTLQETMGVALNDVAESFGFAGASAQTDLYSALQDGSITFDEFNNRIIELNKGVGGFAERALIASEGIRTSFTNIRTAVVTGLANMIQTVDKAMQERGFGSIAENLDKVKVAVQQAFAEINAVLPAFVNAILDVISGLDDFISKWDWLIIGILAGVTAFQVLSTVVPIIIAVYNAVKLWGGLILMIRSFKDGITLLTMAFPLLTNPIFLVSAAIGALVAIGVLLYKNWDTIKEKASELGQRILEVWTSVKEWTSETWENIKMTVVEAVTNVWNSITEWFGQLPTWFSETWNSIVETVTLWAENMVTKAIEVGTQFVENISTFFSELPYNVGFFLGEVIGTVIQWGIDMWNKAIETGTNFLTSISEFFSQLPGRVSGFLTTTWMNVTTWATNMWTKAKETGANFINGIVRWFSQLPGRISTWLTNAYNNVATWASNMWNKAIEAGSQFITNVINYIQQLPGRIQTWLTNTISRLTTWVSNMGSKGREAGTDLLNKTVNAVKGLPGKMASAGGEVVRGFWRGIKGLGGWIRRKVSDFFGGIVDGVKSKLKIFSPSRVFRDEIGKMIVQGFGLGIERNEKDAINPMNQMLDNVIGVFDSQTSGLGATFSVTGDGNISSAMNDLMESASLVMDDMISLPNGNGIIQRAVASGNASSGKTSNITNHNGVKIYIEKIENNSDSDIPRILEETAWILDRERGGLSG